MADTKIRYEKECEYARMALKNVIIHNNNPEMVKNARIILGNKRLFDTFVQKRFDKKYPKTDTDHQPNMISKIMSWIPFKH